MESANPMPKYDSSSVGENAYSKKVETVTPPRERVVLQKMTLLIDAKVRVRGAVSGRQYEFSGAGSSADVDIRDVDDLLGKRQGGRQCCGGSDIGNQVFQLSEK